MSLLSRLVLVLILLAPAAVAQEAGSAEQVKWSKDLSAAFAQAKAEKKILMICVNAKQVRGSSKEEPAAKGLRGVTAWVERPGCLRIGDPLRLHVPDQRPWRPD